MILRGSNILLIVIFSLTTAYSQQLSHQVLLPAAGVAAGSGINYSQTIGETAVTLFNSEDFVLTQGFQQPGIKLIAEIPPVGTGIEVYPNPVADYLRVEFFGETGRSFKVLVMTISGSVVYTRDLKFAGKYWFILEIPVGHFGNGIYFVRIISTDGVIGRSFKIEKI